MFQAALNPCITAHARARDARSLTLCLDLSTLRRSEIEHAGGDAAGGDVRSSKGDAWLLAQALFQDTGAGDGTWRRPNPRALSLLPRLLVDAGQLSYLTKLITNMHFIIQKARECGVAELRHDLHRADEMLKDYISRGGGRSAGASNLCFSPFKAPKFPTCLVISAFHGPEPHNLRKRTRAPQS
jgi:hypothetical protein